MGLYENKRGRSHKISRPIVAPHGDMALAKIMFVLLKHRQTPLSLLPPSLDILSAHRTFLLQPINENFLDLSWFPQVLLPRDIYT